MAELRRPISLHTVWLHIDRLDREDGLVWAVQWRDRKGRHYKTVHNVGIFMMDGHTRRFEGGALQPRAVVEFRDATVTIARYGKQWTAAIDRSR